MTGDARGEDERHKDTSQSSVISCGYLWLREYEGKEDGNTETRQVGRPQRGRREYEVGERREGIFISAFIC